MKTISKEHRIFLIGVLLVLPAGYFVFMNILNELGYPYLFDISWPTLQSWGIQESLGWNINLLILFGPVVAAVMNLLFIIRMEVNSSGRRIDFQVSVAKRWWNLAIVLASGFVLFIFAVYLFLENCNCWARQ